jgi:hypothetical protein
MEPAIYLPGRIHRADGAEWDVAADAGHDAVVGYREEHCSGFRIVTVTSSAEVQVEAIADVLAADLSTVSEADVFERLDKAETTPQAIVRRMGEWTAFHYSSEQFDDSRPFDPRYRQVLERHLAHPHRQVRLASGGSRSSGRRRAGAALDRGACRCTPDAACC